MELRGYPAPTKIVAIIVAGVLSSEMSRIRGEAQEGQRLAIEVHPILSEPAAAVEPSNGALDDPTFGQHHKSFGLIGALDDFGFKVGQDFHQGVAEFCP